MNIWNVSIELSPCVHPEVLLSAAERLKLAVSMKTSGIGEWTKCDPNPVDANLRLL